MTRCSTRARFAGAVANALLLLAGASHCSASDYTFSWSHPHPQGNALHGAAFADATTGYAVGDRGAVVRTTDGGQSWSLATVFPDFATDLEDLVILDDGDLLAVGLARHLSLERRRDDVERRFEPVDRAPLRHRARDGRHALRDRRRGPGPALDGLGRDVVASGIARWRAPRAALARRDERLCDGRLPSAAHDGRRAILAVGRGDRRTSRTSPKRSSSMRSAATS